MLLTTIATELFTGHQGFIHGPRTVFSFVLGGEAPLFNVVSINLLRGCGARSDPRHIPRRYRDLFCRHPLPRVGLSAFSCGNTGPLSWSNLVRDVERG